MLYANIVLTQKKKQDIMYIVSYGNDNILKER